jgi:hypothetical protein
LNGPGADGTASDTTGSASDASGASSALTRGLDSTGAAGDACARVSAAGRTPAAAARTQVRLHQRRDGQEGVLGRE